MDAMRVIRQGVKAWYLDYWKDTKLEWLELKFITSLATGETHVLMQDFDFLVVADKQQAFDMLKLVELLATLVASASIPPDKAIVVKLECGNVFSYKTVARDPDSLKE